MRTSPAHVRLKRMRLAVLVAGLLGIAMLSAPMGRLAASTLAIQSTNPRAGVYAARVTVSSSCGVQNHVNVSGSVSSGTFDGCNSVTSDATVTGSGPVLFRAGERIALRSGFRVESGAELQARIEPSLYPDAYMQDDTPTGETRYAARFYVDTTQLAQAASNRFFPFVAFRDGSTIEVRVGLRWRTSAPAERRAFLEVRRDDGSFLSTENGFELTVPSGWRWIEVGWEAASAPGANDGMVYLCVDSLASGCTTVGSIDNDQASIEYVRLGAHEVPTAGSGTIDFDDFASRRSLHIGPEPPPL